LAKVDVKLNTLYVVLAKTMSC